MMNDLIKKEIHELVDKCNNKVLLEETKIILETANNGDWWDELSEEDKNLVQESELQYGKGDFISHQELMQRFEAWKKK
ncbi:MAG TPA: hypothetical protein VI548_11255 [Chitinophagaceae bacterium]|nr:hypothetical protein [Chitinophagaceae bacterium]